MIAMLRRARAGLAWRWAGVALVVAGPAGCIEPFDGAHVQFTLSSAVASPCKMLTRHAKAIADAGLTVPKACTGDLARDRFLYHYELWATVNQSAVVRLKSFTVQPHLVHDPTDPKDFTKYELFDLERQGVLLANGREFKIGMDVAFDDLSAEDQDEIKQRMVLVAPVLSITSFSTKKFAEGASNRLHPDLFLGNPSQLTRPFNGTYLGAVEGFHPFGPAKISGAEVKVEPTLEGLDSLWITIEHRDPDRSDPKPSPLVLLSGTTKQIRRGTVNVEAVSAWDQSVTASFAVFPSLGEEDHF